MQHAKFRGQSAFLLAFVFLTLGQVFAQGLGNSGVISGKVLDPSGAAVPGVSIEATNPVSGFQKTVQTDGNGQFTISNVPFAHYHVTATMAGFQPDAEDANVRSTITTPLDFTLSVATASENVTVEADVEDVIRNTPVASTDVDRALIEKLPTESVNAPLSSLVSLSTPGISSDSNGLFHPEGEHADTSFSIDGQPISDQQSRIFSNQLPVSAIQSINVINGAIPAEYGDKASLVVQTTTRSGLDTPVPHGTVSFSYGSFGTSSADLSVGFGGKKLGNFISLGGVNSGRYLDTPEFLPLHDHGNAENLFDRIDYQANAKDSFHVNLFASRSWFQQPNQYDQQANKQDQRAQIFSYNLSPSWTHLFSNNALLSVNPYLRQDQFHYYPSRNVFDDTPTTLAQSRRLQNAGLKLDFSYSKGIHNIKAGANFYHTFLHEGFSLGVTDPTFNAVCLDNSGAPVVDPTVLDPACGGVNQKQNPNFQPGLLPHDLSRGGSPFLVNGHTDIKQEAFYLQDNINWKDWSFSVGARGDIYHGLSHRNMFEPRVGGSYNIKKTGSVLRVAYSRLMLTPYNENLIVSSSTGIGGLANNLSAFGQNPLIPAKRDQYNAGFEQSFGKFFILDADYVWKYTDPDFDFDVVLNTPLTFPIQWKRSKIDGVAVRLTVPNYHGFSAYSVIGHTRSRFFGPEVGGIIFNNPANVGSTEPFRIDHDQAFQQTTHFSYQPKKTGPWYSFNWRYESGQVAGHAPFATDTTTPVDLTFLTPDQQAQAQITCGGVRATLNAPLSSCAPSQLSSPLLTIPKPGTQNPDKNPARIAPRTMFDTSVGWDNVLRGDRYKTNVSFTVVNLTNQYSLYNFLSTFSGTHFVTPRTYEGQIAFVF